MNATLRLLKTGCWSQTFPSEDIKISITKFKPMLFSSRLGRGKKLLKRNDFFSLLSVWSITISPDKEPHDDFNQRGQKNRIAA